MLAEPIRTPRLELPIGELAEVRGRRYLIERRIGSKYQFLALDNREPVFLDDRELFELGFRGEFCVLTESGRPLRLSVSPLVVSPEEAKENARKHAYVLACKALGSDFLRSRRVLLPIIASVAAEHKEKKPPCFNSVLGWYDRWQANGSRFGTAVYSRQKSKGPMLASRFTGGMERAITAAEDRWLRGHSKGAAYAWLVTAVNRFNRRFGTRIERAELSIDLFTADGSIKPPCLRTFERRCGAIPRLLADASRVGMTYAIQRNRTSMMTLRPSMLFAEVEVDHCLLDIQLVDESGLLLGRPDLLLFTDRASAAIVGLALGFEEPSYASFLAGLQHTMYPKSDPELKNLRNPWPCFGRIQKLFVDNALHFIGSDIASAAHELGMHVVPLPPRAPELKGQIERTFRTLGVGVVHNLPGTTLSNPTKRSQHENLGQPCLTLAQFRQIILKFIVDYHNVRRHRGLGLIRGVGDIPLQRWNELCANFFTPSLPAPSLFMALAGSVEYRTIQRNGVTWDHICYEAPVLASVLGHPKHRRRGEFQGPTNYKVVRDPSDLSKIVLHNHFNDELITLPATQAHGHYAAGLSLHQHKVIIRHARARTTEEIEMEHLLKAQAELVELADRLRRHPSRGHVERRVARYLHVDAYRPMRADVIAREPGSDPDGQVGTLLETIGLVQPSAGDFDGAPKRGQARGPVSEPDDLLLLRSSRDWEAEYD